MVRGGIMPKNNKTGFFKILKKSYEEFKKFQLEEKKKEALLNEKMNYQFLEELVQKCNENPQLKIKITLRDGTILDVNTTPKRKQNYIGTQEENFLEVH